MSTESGNDTPKMPKRIVIMGAGGRDFHNFNLLYRHDPTVRVVAFTATQIPFQQGRRYPPVLAGPNHPGGIPIVGEGDLERLVRDEGADEVVFAYSDISHQQLMEKASEVLALGADFSLIGPKRTMLEASIPVISICAVRTGCGKSPLTRHLCQRLLKMGRRPVVVRHPMAYGSLEIRVAERFDTFDDLDRYECTLEEREEYEGIIRLGVPLFAGVDYRHVLHQAQLAGDVLLWDGGNNDWPFIRPDLELVLVDPFRPGDETASFPGMVNLLRAHLVIVSKADGAPVEGVQIVKENASKFNPDAEVVSARLRVEVSEPKAIRGRRVVVVEDGPTLTHGGMPFGAGVVAARQFGAKTIVDPRPYAVGSLLETYQQYPHLHKVVPAMGYSEAQIAHLQATLEAIPCDLILCATPIDLGRLLRLHRPLVPVHYEFEEMGGDAIGKAVLGLLEGGG